MAADDDALIDQALERAGREVFTTDPPRTLKGQINYLIRKLGSARAVAAELGVTADSVNRYRRGARKHPPNAIQDRISDAVRSRWQPRVREHARRAAAQTGITVEFRATFGYRAPDGTTDESRERLLTLHLPPERAGRLLDAQGSRSAKSPNEVLAEAAGELYFRERGTRAHNLDVELTGIDYIAARYSAPLSAPAPEPCDLAAPAHAGTSSHGRAGPEPTRSGKASIPSYRNSPMEPPHHEHALTALLAALRARRGPGHRPGRLPRHSRFRPRRMFGPPHRHRPHRLPDRPGPRCRH
ncbi:hypothetical protein [Streptomyces sp. NPDC046727]|uniref:telomere-protecting terminal protein Tpg n=1 Tax=Streptomyces sp. NPDC046727 TaxID=3155373 RepID=UPI0034118567